MELSEQSGGGGRGEDRVPEDGPDKKGAGLPVVDRDPLDWDLVPGGSRQTLGAEET